MNKKLYWMINGKIVPENKLTIPVNDLGLLRGFAVFDFLVTYNNHPFLLTDHLDRLFNSASSINLFNPWTKPQIKKMVYGTLAANKPNFEKTIKIILTGGESQDGFTPENKTNIIILIEKWGRSPQEIYKKGIKLISNYYQRYLPQSKTSCYVEALRKLPLMKQQRAFEILYYDDTQVFECSKSNIFALMDGTILTPKNNVLRGITRKVVLEKLNLSIPILEKDFSLSTLLKAKEIFITKSNDEIVPVVNIDDTLIGEGKVGKVTKMVMSKFNEYVKSNDWLKENLASQVFDPEAQTRRGEALQG